MASISLFLLLAVLFANQVIAQKNDSNIIRLGSKLSPKSNPTSWVSASGLFAFGFYQQGHGFAVGIWLKGEPHNTIVWTANRNSPPLSSDSVIELTKHGHLVLRNETGIEILIADANDVSEPADSASMLDSGNFVLYSKNRRVIWQSFDFPTHTILGGQTLSAGEDLISASSESNQSSGHYILSMQNDGNLVAYFENENPDDAYWVLHTYRPAASQLTLSLTGFLYLRNPTNTIKVLASSNYLEKNRSLIYRATLDVDGNFRLYVHPFEKNTGQIIWQALSDQCQVYGFCGFNSYCSTTVAGKAVCECYPGFMPIQRNNSMLLECQQMSKDDCKTSLDPRMLYNVTPLQGVQWSRIPYLVITSMKMETCGESCLEDCDCGAAFYVNDTCRKYKLPLLFGRINQNASDTALFKWPLGTVVTRNPRKPGIFYGKKNLILTLVLTLGSISSLCIVFAMSIFFIYRRQAHSYTDLSASASLGFTEDCSLRIFSFDELVNYTGNFTEKIGRGSFGVVYKGTISRSNRRIAVKKLDTVVDEGEREFQAEITAIARTHHRNLVQLIGYCIDDSRKLLVYEYMSNGSLADFLFKADMRLSWKQRVKIVLDVARGVLYLHEECEVCIVHCNIKPQNILIDEMWTAKLSDFGLARLSMPEHSRTSTPGNEVTNGYLAPEWQKDASTSVKVDIYSYGMVLLEIICCRRSIDLKVSSEEEIMLSSWVYNCFVRGELNKLVVDDFEDVEWKAMERMVKVGLWCVQENMSLRPSMKNVILMLEGLKDIPIPPPPTPLL